MRAATSFHFVMKAENLSFRRRPWSSLPSAYGLEPPERPHTPAAAETPEERKFMRQLLTRAHERYAQTLRDDQAAAGKRASILPAAGWGEELIQAFGLGFAPDGWDFPLRAAETGAPGRPGNHGETGPGFTQRPRWALRPLSQPRHLPHHGYQGASWPGSGGACWPPMRSPKYLNSPESPVFNKRRLLFGGKAGAPGHNRCGQGAAGGGLPRTSSCSTATG